MLFEFVSGAFYGCDNLSTIIPITLEQKFNDAFRVLSTNSQIDIGGGAIDLGSSAASAFAGFAFCYSLTPSYFVGGENITNWAYCFDLSANLNLFDCDLSQIDWSSSTNLQSIMQSGKPQSFTLIITTTTYLIKWDSDPSVGGLDFGILNNFTTDFGTIQYSSAGAAAHASLVAKSLIINDGGQNAF